MSFNERFQRVQELLGQKIKSIQFLSDPDSPGGDWQVLVVVAITLVLILSMFNAYLFLNVDKGTLFTVDTSLDAPATTVSREALNDALERMNLRVRFFEELLKEAPRVSDPSR